MIILLDAKKLFDKIENALRMKKTTNRIKLGTRIKDRRTFSQYAKDYLRKTKSKNN